ncbi:uncharacterized protein LOC115367971 [Myripristis murdjan]|uniref:uncharacterized protein LOC115367971 n=1 Tax=Myripristis murdjan TaxID=586833 RepID=UPI001175D910|nr:uncharacterized protein LOC115367971 [Myripristis murdjan]
MAVPDDSVIPDSTPNLLHLLLLAQLFGHSVSHPVHHLHLCTNFGSMIRQLNVVQQQSKKLHDSSGTDLSGITTETYSLEGLPSMEHNASQINSVKLNESLSQLYLDIQAFKLHVDWLKTVRENFSLPHSQTVEGASTHLLLLSNLTSGALHKISETVPEPPSPSLPRVSSSFSALRYSLEVSQRLQVFCLWSKRVLLHLKGLRGCHS